MYSQILSEDVFVIKKVKNTVPWAYVIEDINGKEIVEMFYGIELQKINHTENRKEKVIRKNSGK